MNAQEQVNELNKEVKCTLGTSSIHGVGVVALRDIKRFERLYCFSNEQRKWYYIPQPKFSELRPEVKDIILGRWPMAWYGHKFQSPRDDVWLASFINHSENPNYDNGTDIALRDIKAGEEVTEDYRLMEGATSVFPFLQGKG